MIPSQSIRDWPEARADWTEVSRLKSADGWREVAIVIRSDGLFKWVEVKWLPPLDEGDGPLDDGYWQIDQISGLHGTAASAEKDARHTVDWLAAEH